MLALALPADVGAIESVAAPDGLRAIMIGLGEHNRDIAAAISREDWPGVGRHAAAIAGHGAIPHAEQHRLHAELGERAAAFEALDQHAHDAAEALAEAAASGQGKIVIAAFADMQNACLDCHQAFRPAMPSPPPGEPAPPVESAPAEHHHH